jgi:hypothetical protein
MPVAAAMIAPALRARALCDWSVTASSAALADAVRMLAQERLQQ